MEIYTFRHKSENGAEHYLDSLEEGLDAIEQTDSPDMVVGPDFSLASSLDRLNTPRERQAILKRIEKLSRRFPKTRFLPGTMTWYQGDKAYNSAPFYFGGKMADEFVKKRDNGLSILAEQNGKIGVRGDNRKNFFDFNGERIAVEICGDHGSQNVNGVDVELILAYDNKAGFYIGALNDSWSHYGVVSDGYSGSNQGFHWNAQEKCLTSVPRKRIGNFDVFEVGRSKE